MSTARSRGGDTNPAGSPACARPAEQDTPDGQPSADRSAQWSHNKDTFHRQPTVMLTENSFPPFDLLLIHESRRTCRPGSLPVGRAAHSTGGSMHHD